MPRCNQHAERCQPGISLQPRGDQRDQNAERGPRQNSLDWFVSDLVGPEQPGVDRRGAHQSDIV